MSEREQGEQLGQPLFLDETPDLHRREMPEPSDVDALFADEDALPPGSRVGTPARAGLSLPDSWSALSGRLNSPAMGWVRGALLVAMVLAAALLGFLAARALLN